MEEITTEISVYLAMLYHLIEVFKGHDDFADELSKPRSPSSGDRSQMSHSEHGSSATSLLLQRGVWPSRQKRQGLPSEEGT
jgi:hypothetical protein